MGSQNGHPFAGHVDPATAWRALETVASARLIDVRTQAEWAFVGLPALESAGKKPWLVEWKRYPDMAPNPEFVDQVVGAIDAEGATEVYFICRSGARSLEAAIGVGDALADRPNAPKLLNVAEGFEGDRDAQGRRGSVGGWKARGLPWSQS